MSGAMPFADYLDGKTALVRRSGVRVESDSLDILLPDGEILRWPLGQLRRIPDQAAPHVLTLTSTKSPLARLYLSDRTVRAAIEAGAHGLDRPPPMRGRARVLGWAAAAVASVALIVLVLVPVMADQLARYLPPEGEKALGDATFEQIRAALDETGLGALPKCERADGVAALTEIEARLTEGVDLPYPLTVSVLDHEMINAFALPGGHIVFFRGLIDTAETPEEVAAVFAHEMGHVVSRDPARIALRSAGSIGVLGLLLGDFAGGAVVLFVVEHLIQASYTQEAEAAADAFAHDRMRAAGLPPEAMASFFRRLRDQYGDTSGFVAHLMAHPTLGDRIARAEAAAHGDPGRPALDDQQWAALRAICD